jgi:mycofactocin glycosyltransferase
VTTVEMAPGVRLHTGPGGALLVGGQPLRVLKLNAAAAGVITRWRSGPTPPAPAERALAERLHRLGLAVLRRSASPYTPGDVTIVVPVRDRAADLARCLASLGGGSRVLVVDDGSRDPAAVAAVVREHGGELVARPRNGGPAAARNTGLALVGTPLVAFVDSDCELPAGWLSDLLPVLAEGTDVVGPRVVGRGGPGVLARYETTAGPLDLGPDPGPVGAGTRVGYLPAAVLLCRRDALGDGFDEAMRVGEDVDLVWRAPGAVRYEPSVVVRHATRDTFAAWFRQRYGYGRGAGPLADRHPGRLAPALVSRGAVPALLCLAAGRPGRAAACTALAAIGLWGRLPAAPGRAAEAVRLTGAGLGWTVFGLAEAAARPWLPAMLAASVLSRRARLATAVAIGARLWRTSGRRAPGLAVPAWAAVQVADDLAYGAGVWTGVARTGNPGPLLPRVT